MDIYQKIKKFLDQVKTMESYESATDPDFKGFGMYFMVVYPTRYRNEARLYFNDNVPQGVRVVLSFAWKAAMESNANY